MRGIVQRLANLGLDQFAEAAPQTVNRNFYGAFIGAELAGSVRLGKILRIAREPWLERFEMRGFSGGRVFFGQGSERPVEDRQCPSAIKLAIRTRDVRIGQLQAGRSVGSGVDGFNRLACAALQPARVVVHVREKMFDGAQEERTETASLWIDVVDAVPGQEAGEEFLGEIARGIFVRDLTADESK